MQFFLLLHQWQDFGLIVLRLAIGAIFLVHGTGKWAMWATKPSDYMSAGMLNLMRFLSIVEPLGAIAILAGFLTQLAAAGLSIIMLGAIYLKITAWKSPFSANDKLGWEFDFVIIGGAISLFLSG
ncbi:MAG TPA: DoxX family protein, partial [Chryseolinea sp.]|nr:DoxX family protein [Chryseolinea sp.]